MLKDIWNKIVGFFDKEITTEFRERVGNPFFVALFFSWVSWNWELIFILFNFDSETTLWGKISCIKEYIGDDSKKARDKMLWGPIGYAFLAILLFSALKQGALLINLLFLNWIQPGIHKIVGSSKIVTKDRFDKINRKVTRLIEEYEKKKDDVIDLSEENRLLRTRAETAEGKTEESKFEKKELEEKYNKLSKNNLNNLFEGKWLNTFIFPDGTIGSEPLEIIENNKYFSANIHIFNLDMIEYDVAARTLKFRKVGVTDNRRAVNDLKIINVNEYRGTEDVNTIITYTREDNNPPLSFLPYYSKHKVIIGAKTSINFKLKNNVNFNIDFISYQFTSFFNGVKFITSPKHDFKFNLLAKAEHISHFDEVNPLEYYFENRHEPGTYDSEITLEYKINGINDSQTITRFVRLYIVKIIINYAKYFRDEKFKIVTERIREFADTGKLEFLVDNGTVSGPGAENDPYPDQIKTLEVSYSINGIQKFKSAIEGEMFILD